MSENTETKRSYTRMTAEQIEEIGNRFANENPADLAKEFGVSLSTIFRYGKENGKSNGKKSPSVPATTGTLEDQAKAFVQSLRDRAAALNSKADELESSLAEIA